VLGEDHPDTLNSLNNLGLVLRNQDKLEVAEGMHQRALEGRENVLGEDHPDTLNSLSNLGFVHHDQGKHGAAEGMLRRALEGHEKVQGKDHPDTLNSLNNLGLVLHDQEQCCAFPCCRSLTAKVSEPASCHTGI
jgi:Tfp pilus assembly protein PilF